MSAQTFTWCPHTNPDGKSTFRVLSAQFGDGYAQEVGDGINTESQSWPLEFVGYEAQIQPIRDFLRQHQGFKPFMWTPPTFAKYLDAVNFGGANPSADPTEHLPDERWIVSQKQSETPEAVTFVLSSPLQFDGIQLPARPIIANTCGFLIMAAPDGGYRGALCGYTGAAMYDKDGNPVTDPSLDKCSGIYSACELRFGKWQPVRFGGFASADRIR